MLCRRTKIIESNTTLELENNIYQRETMTEISSPQAETDGKNKQKCLCDNVDLSLECNYRLAWERDTSGDSQSRENGELQVQWETLFQCIDEKQLRRIPSINILAYFFVLFFETGCMCLPAHMSSCAHTHNAHAHIHKPTHKKNTRNMWEGTACYHHILFSEHLLAQGTWPYKSSIYHMMV